MGRVICIANQKGGVGKTTTAINLAASIGAQDQRVLLVDLDAQANATSGLGESRDQSNVNVFQAMLGAHPLHLAIKHTAYANVDLVPSTADLIGAEIALISRDDRDDLLKRALASIRDRYRFVLLDCPPSLGLLTVNALTASDGVLAPVQSEYYAMEGLSQLLTTVERVREVLNPALELEGVLLTMYDPRNNLARQVEQELRVQLAERVFSTVIPRNVRLSEAPSFGKPALYYDVRSTGAQAYQALAREVLARSSEASVA
ncbi:MAG: ParA family protein [Deltaproteobacteria bacterium]|jgi:chromosome partitioning protein|nr:ParA family protein [Deltaproteobacteria bacterium]